MRIIEGFMFVTLVTMGVGLCLILWALVIYGIWSAVA